jgi:hypothetical protein
MIDAYNLKLNTISNIEIIKNEYLKQIEKEVIEASRNGFFDTRIFINGISKKILYDIETILKRKNYNVNIYECGINHFRLTICWN